jgi:hypothetical protein
MRATNMRKTPLITTPPRSEESSKTGGSLSNKSDVCQLQDGDIASRPQLDGVGGMWNGERDASKSRHIWGTEKNGIPGWCARNAVLIAEVMF